MTTIRGRLAGVDQPPGGFIDPRVMVPSRRDDAHQTLPLRDETVEPEFLSMAVDHLSRLRTGTPPVDVFIWAIHGAKLLNDPGAFDDIAELLSPLYPLVVDDDAIRAACKLVGYVRVFHAGPDAWNPDARTTPDTLTTDHIRLMVERCIPFFYDYGPGLMLEECVFPGGYSGPIHPNLDAHKMPDTLWDFDTSENGPTKEHTLALLASWLTGKREGTPQFRSVTHLGVFNPRLNTIYRLPLADVPAPIIEAVERDVIGSWPAQAMPVIDFRKSQSE